METVQPVGGVPAAPQPAKAAEKKPRYNLLNSLEDVRRNLARTIREAQRVGRQRRVAPGQKPKPPKTLEEEKLELERVRCLITGYRALAEMLSGVELERRLKALEEKAQAGAH